MLKVPLLLLLPLPLLLTQEAGEDQAPGTAVIESTTCARCHSNADRATAMRDADGAGIAPFDLWQGTMMANSARDPLWRAAVAAEVAGTPAAADAIERKCLSCHAPMAHQVGIEDHGTGTAMHVLDCEDRAGDLARDGVSCTICHGMLPDGLGTPGSFTAGYELDPWRRMFGPHVEPFEMPMRRMAGFTPTHGDHIMESSHCGSCHTLETEALTPAGEPTGHVLLEQGPYIEWRNSAYSTEAAEPGPDAASCQACHLATADAAGRTYDTRIARNPGGRNFPPTRPRTPFGSHLIVGANTMVLELFRDHGEELGVTAPPEAFDAAVRATREQLGERSARVDVVRPRVEDGRLVFDVQVQNLAGHKLPTAHPSRRVWLVVRVLDAEGELLFGSGLYDERGRILGADGAVLPSELAGGPIDPHRDRVDSPGEVVQYRAVMADPAGEATHLLLRGASFGLDTRLLPRGWRADGPDAGRTAPTGFEDDDFVAGGDRVTFDVGVDPEAVGAIEVQLVHQSYSARWAAELFRFEAPDIERFAELYAKADPRPNVLASQHIELRR